MNFKKSVIIVMILIMTVALTVGGCGGGSNSGGTKKIVHAHISGPTGSGWYPMSVLLADIWMDNIPGMNITVVEGGAIGNIREINVGQNSQSGLAFASDFADAIAGRGVFEGDVQENVMAIGALYPVWWNFGVLDKSPIKSLEDFVLRGGKAVPGNPGDASEQAIRRVLESMGYSYEALEKNGGWIAYGGYGDGATQLRDGIIDLVSQGGAPGSTSLVEVDATNPIRVLPIPEDILKKLDEAGFGYTISMPIPPGTYKNQTEPVPTIVTMTVALANKNMDEETVYQMTKALWGNLDRVAKEQPARAKLLDPAIGYSEITNPEKNLHPGALRYYKEIGVAK